MAPKPTLTPDITVGHLESRILNGALVTFQHGASVLSLKHPADYSAIEFSCNKPRRNAGHIAAYIFDMSREPVGLSRIHVLTDPDACPTIAHVQVQDPNFAARVKGEFERYLRFVPRTEMAVRQVPVEIKYEEAFVDLPSMKHIEQHLLKDRYTRLRMKKGPVAPECAVCLTDAEDPFFTPCGHRYCRTCFIAQCSSVTNREIPVRCLGNSGKCSRIFLLPELELLLQSESFEQLLSRSFTLYFRTVNTIKQCPTPNCHHLYRTSTDGSVLTCFKCAIPICTTCHAPSHSGMTCAIYQRVGEVKVFQRWYSEMDIRRCPGCRILVEKVGGCEKVVCGCGARFCWGCMEVWDEEGRCRCLRGVRGESVDGGRASPKEIGHH